jgi:hypothetical protein
MVTAVANGLRPALAGGALARVLSSRQLLDLATILLRQAGTPGMLAAGRTELEAITRGVASAIAGDERGLLAPDDWLAVARIAATEAAANPGRLFPLATTSPDAGPAADLIAVLLASGTRDVARGRDGGAVLFGATLRDAIVCTLRAQTGRGGAAVDRPAAVAALAGRLNALAADEPGRYGSREWLALYRALLPRALRGDPVDAVPRDALDRLLAGEGIA